MSQPEFLSWEIMMALHQRSLERWGGADGIRDRAGLESALGAGGNKRTAMACAATFLEGNGCVDRANDAVLYDAMIAIAKRELDKSGLAEVLRQQFPME